jgi:hypothetical protein
VRGRRPSWRKRGDAVVAICSKWSEHLPSVDFSRHISPRLQARVIDFRPTSEMSRARSQARACQGCRLHLDDAHTALPLRLLV